jgi:hypothetical protein
MTLVLERYPDPECALLLGCSDRQIRQARVTGLAKMANPVETTRETDIAHLSPARESDLETEWRLRICRKQSWRRHHIQDLPASSR